MIEAPDFLADIEADAAAPALPGDAELKAISDAVERAKKIIDWLEKNEGTRARGLATLNEIETRILPELMRNAGVSKLTTTGDITLELKQEYRGHISEERTAPAHEWLRDNKHGDLIKAKLTAQFARGQEEKATDIAKQLQDLGVTFEQKEAVHNQTLNVFVREQSQRGTPVPVELFGVFIGDAVRLPRPKKSKTKEQGDL